ncbi:MAG: YlmC/YmxH family sporulation protein [Clostridia bacterium]|nr:YlmC/YmxH family sporulation protein [Clostridia bacterium]
MRWSELAGKEIIDVADATRLGRVEDADLVLEEDGSIASLIASRRGFGLRRPAVAIPWSQVVRVGPEAMLVATGVGPAERPRAREAGRPGDRLAGQAGGIGDGRERPY